IGRVPHVGAGVAVRPPAIHQPHTFAMDESGWGGAGQQWSGSEQGGCPGDRFTAAQVNHVHLPLASIGVTLETAQKRTPPLSRRGSKSNAIWCLTSLWFRR